jgi:uncharacterized membrane protein YsdA (DUF1294 family)
VLDLSILRNDVKMLIGLYLTGVNLLGLIYFFIDKQKAKKQSWRTPEATLFTIAIFGGSLGCLLGMYLFRHKTKKPAFYIGMPLILLIQVLIIFIILFLMPVDLRTM